MVGSAGDSLSL